MIMSRDEVDSLGLFTVGSKLLQAYNYDVGLVASMSRLGHVDVITGHRVHSMNSS